MKKAFLLLCLFGLIASNSFSQRLETIVQTGHSQAVLAVTSDSSGKYVVSAGKDKTVKLWDKKTGLELRAFHGHNNHVLCVDISPDLQYIVSGSLDGTIIVHDMLTGEQLFKTPVASERVTSVKFIDSKSFITAGYDKEAKVWDFVKNEVIATIPVEPSIGTGYGIQISLSSDNKTVALAEDNHTISIVSTRNWKVFGKIVPESGTCGGCGTLTDFSPDNKNLLVVPDRSPAFIYSIKDKTKKVLNLTFKDVAGAYYLPGNRHIIVGEEEKLTLINLESEKPEFTYTFENDVNSIALSGQGHLAIGMDNKKVDIFSLKKQQPVLSLKGIVNEAEKTGIEYDPNSFFTSNIASYLRLKNPIIFEPDSKGYLKGKSGLKVRSWDIFNGKPKEDYTGHEKAVVAMKVNTSKGLLATGGADGIVKVWDLKNKENILTIKAHYSPVYSVNFNPVYNQLLTTSQYGKIKVWNLDTGELVSKIQQDNNSSYDAAFTPNGLYIVTGGLDSKVRLWEPDSKTLVREFVGHTSTVSSVDLSKDGKFILSGSWDGSIRMWNLETGLMISKILADKPVYAVRFSNDEKQIISAGGDRLIKIYDAENLKPLKTLHGHKAEVSDIDQSPDGKFLISYSLDGVVKLWDFEKEYSLFDHIHIGAKDWMVKNNEGYFNGTDGALKKIHFVQGVQAYTADQFFDKYYRPDLLKTSAHGKRSGKAGNIENQLQKKPLPSVKIAAYPEYEGHKAIVMVKVKNQGGGAQNLKISHNGKSITIKPFDLPKTKGKEVVYTDTLKMVGGKNVFTATAQNQDFVEAYKAQTELFSDNKEKSSTCHIFAIGLNKYKNPDLNLSFAKTDAEEFGEILQDKGTGLYKKVVIHNLYDESASRTNILDRLEKLSEEIQLHDVFVFFYAGHGSFQDEKFYLIPNECVRAYDSGELERSGISAQELQEKLRKIKALKQMVVMDACHSGGSIDALTSRGTIEEKAIAHLARSTGIHILASSGEKQFSKEVTELKHGIFTYALLKGLSGEADGAPEDGKITVFELKSYLDDQVPILNEKYSGKAQYPYTFSRGQDFPICLE